MASRILVTGVHGVVGSGLAEAWGPGRVVGLARQPGRGVADEVVGDVTRPGLGLDRAGRGQLGRIDGVVHSAAITSFARPEAEMRAVNVDGTANAVRWAETAGVPFCLISTIYVNRRDGSEETGRSAAYRESKRAAEELVRAAGVPWTILRLTVVIGDSATGRTPRFQGIYAAMKSIVTGGAHLIPIAPGSRLDFLPRDHVASWVKSLVEAGVTGEHWITAGERAVTIEEFVDRCRAYAVRRGWSVPRPRLVDAEMVHRLIMPAFGDVLDADLRRRLRLFTDLLGPLTTDQVLPTVVSDVPDLPGCLDAALAYWGDRVRLVREPVRA